jgi:hypothetical protein
MKTPFYPSIEELRALEVEAHRARSRELLRLFQAAGKVLQRLVSPPTVKGVRHA